MQDTNTDSQPELQRIEFRGTGGEYFRIWIVNLALTILTLGIYSAWAKVRRLKYFYGSTQLAGHAFDYHGNPIAILKGRLVAVLVLVAYSALAQLWPLLGAALVIAFWLAIPWIVTRAQMFQMRMTSYRGLRWDFEPDYGGAFKAMLLAPLATALSLGLLFPWATRLRYRWLIENTAYGKTFCKLDIGLKPFVMALLYTLPLIVAGALLVTLGGGVMSLLTAGGGDGPPAPDAVGRTLVWMLVGFYLPLIFVFYLVLAVWKRTVMNATLPATTLGPVRLHCKLSARWLAWIYVSNLVGIVLTLGLFMPWAKVRAAKYQLECMGYVASGPVDEFHASETERTSAVGEEIGELMDVDISL